VPSGTPEVMRSSTSFCGLTASIVSFLINSHFSLEENRSVTDFLSLDTALTKCPRAVLSKSSLSNVLKKEAKAILLRNSDRANLSS